MVNGKKDTRAMLSTKKSALFVRRKLFRHDKAGRPSRIANIGPVTLGLAASAFTLSVALTEALAREITVWSGFPEMEPFYERVAASMKGKFPDLTVSVGTIPLREHEKRIALALPSNSAADVLELASSTAQRFVEAGLLKAATDDVAAFVTNNDLFDVFFQTAASHDGTVYGVPLFRGQSALYYNTKMFAKAGLSRPPTTMAEYTEYSVKLTQRDDQGNPSVSGWSLRLSGGGQGIAEKFWINLFQFGGSVLKQTDDGKWIANYASDAGRQTLGQYVDHVHALKTVSPEMPADADAFEREQTAMFIRESWVIGDIAKKAPNLKYATAPLPRGSIALPVNLYVTSEGERGELAWEFAIAANDPDNLMWLLDNVGWLPNRKDVDFSEIIEKKPAFNAFVNYPEDYLFFTLPSVGPIEEILTRLAGRLVNAYNDPSLANNDAAIDRVLEEAANETNRILKREGLLGSN